MSNWGKQTKYGVFEITGAKEGKPKVLGQGSFGSTFEGVRIETVAENEIKEYAAIKVLDPALLTGKTSRLQFIHELVALTAFKHPNLIHYIACGEQEGEVYYAMELCRGGDLRELLLRYGPLSEKAVALIGLQVAAGLRELHQRHQLIHRDLKPSNIMLVDELEPDLSREHLSLHFEQHSNLCRIVDFGLVDFALKAEGETRKFAGSPMYASPEQIMQEPMDFRTDLYSLGMTLWHLLVGKGPFLDKAGEPLGPDEAMDRHTCPEEHEPDLPPRLSPEFRALLAKLLAKHAENRFSTASEVQAALRVFLASPSAQNETWEPMPGTPAAAPFDAEATMTAASYATVGWPASPWLSDADHPVRIPRPTLPSSEATVVPPTVESPASGSTIVASGPKPIEPELRPPAIPQARPDPPPTPVVPRNASATPVPQAQPKPPPSATGSSKSPPPRIDENVQFTIFRPQLIPPDKWHTLLAFAHLSEKPLEDAADELTPFREVQRQAGQILGPILESYREITQDSTRAVPHDGTLTFVPVIPGLEINPPERSFIWAEAVHREEFRVRAKTASVGQTLRGQMTVYLGGIILADIPLAIRVEAISLPTDRPAREAVSARPYRKIFASYSHHDRSVVEEFERFAATLGDRYLRDAMDLRTGQQWRDELRRFIDEADVFQLFWSSNSMRSRQVREEWEYALTLGRTNFVRPTYWESPMPKSAVEDLPPTELKRLHFQRISFPETDHLPTPSAPSPSPASASPEYSPATAPTTPLPIQPPSALPHGGLSKSTPNRWIFVAFAVAAIGILWLVLHFLGTRNSSESSGQRTPSTAPEIADSTPIPIVASPTPTVASEKSEPLVSHPLPSFEVAEPTAGTSLSFSPPQPAGSETPVTADLLIENWNQPASPVVHWSCRVKDRVINGAANIEQTGKNLFRIALDLPSEARNEETCAVDLSLQGWMPLKCVFKRDTEGNFASEGRQTMRRQAGGSSVSPAYMPPPK